ncbi:S24 family peptidase (plasmid) [Thioclava sp. 'Guangxiensis']|uniref:S24 family peptidase n=1 Tax=Thioclava sp. 'Guangxiensis' TaxID=3149044 RepID=UPI0032C447E8
MKTLDEVFVERVKSQLQKLGETPFSFEQKADLPRDALRNILREDAKRAKPNLKRVQEVCSALGLEVYIGPPRPAISEELATKLQDVMHFELAGMSGRADFIARLASGEELGLELKLTSADDDRNIRRMSEDFTAVPLHEASLAAGDGFFNGHSKVTEYLAFRKSWMRRIGVSPSDAVLARIADGETGESMLPSICPGDMVLIDTSQKNIPPRSSDYKSRKSPVFAFATEDGARVKRLATMGDVVILASDNPDYPPEFISKEAWANVNVIGKVVWWGHTAEG